MTKASAQKRAEALALLRAALALAALQLLRALVEWAARPWLGERGAQAAAMAALLAVGFTLLRGRIRALLPARFRRGDVLAACAAAALYATAPANFLEGAPAAANLFCGSILTPAAEEALFRGWLWGELQAALPSGRSVLAWNAALFALWHIGYVVPNLAAGDLAAVAGKVAAGLAYGVLLAAIRRRTGNAWGAFLAHGVCNLFRT